MKTLALIALLLPVMTAAYYSFAPLDPLASFDQAREQTPHAVRADFHMGYGYAPGAYDDGGAYRAADEAATLFAGVARVGWTFDKVWEVDLVVPFANYRADGGDVVSNGVGDIWLAGKAIWYTKKGGEFRMGPRLGIRFAGKEEAVFSDRNVAFDLAAVGYWDKRDTRFRLDCQFGFRQDGKSDRFPSPPGLSLYLLADPAWTLDEEGRWLLGPSAGAYAGVGNIPTNLLWLGGRAQFIIDPNSRLETGLSQPVIGRGYTTGAYSYPVARSTTVYLGIQALIPTTW